MLTCEFHSSSWRRSTSLLEKIESLLYVKADQKSIVIGLLLLGKIKNAKPPPKVEGVVHGSQIDMRGIEENVNASG